MLPHRLIRQSGLVLALATSSLLMGGCGVVDLAASTAGAVISVGGAVVSTGVKAVGAIIPDGDSKKKDEAKPAEAPASAASAP